MTVERHIRMASLTSAAVVAAMLLAPQTASAATYVFSYSGAGITASGTVTTSGGPVANPFPCATCNSGPGFLVTAISGTRNGNPITGLLAPGGLYGNDNLIYPSSPFLDWGDLGFSSNGVNYNVFQGNFGGHSGYYEADSLEPCCYTHPVQFSLSAVPEPATWGLMLAGVFGLGALTRRSRRLQTAAG